MTFIIFVKTFFIDTFDHLSFYTFYTLYCTHFVNNEFSLISFLPTYLSRIKHTKLYFLIKNFIFSTVISMLFILLSENLICWINLKPIVAEYYTKIMCTRHTTENKYFSNFLYQLKHFIQLDFLWINSIRINLKVKNKVQFRKSCTGDFFTNIYNFFIVFSRSCSIVIVYTIFFSYMISNSF